LDPRPFNISEIIGSSLVSFLLSFMLMKVWLPFAPRRSGNVLLVVPVGPLQRLLIHRNQALLVLAYIVIGSLPNAGQGWFLPGTQPAALAGLLIIMMLPLRYVFTENGIALSNGVPRTYKSFRRLDNRDIRSGRRLLAGNATIRLHGRRLERGTAPGMTLHIPASQTAPVTRLLKRHVR
jgi:hypothetical protein